LPGNSVCVSFHNILVYPESLRMRKSACHEAIFGFVLGG
jgi:hypothetical protein